MRHPALGIAALFLWIQCVPAVAADTSPLIVPVPATSLGTDEDVAAVRAAHEAFFRAYLAGDRAATEAILSPDFVFMKGDGTALVRAPYIDALVTEVGDRQLKDFAMKDVFIQILSHETALVGARLSYTLVRDGVRVAAGGRLVDGYRREGGKWKVIYSSFFPNPPAPRNP